MFNDQLSQTATKLVASCNAGTEAITLDTLYAKDCQSVEALAMPGMDRIAKGIDAIKAKHEWWNGAHEVHATSAQGPFMHGDDKFSVIFDMDVTNKQSGERMQMQEVGLYTVDKAGKICREEFFYGAQ